MQSLPPGEGDGIFLATKGTNFPTAGSQTRTSRGCEFP